MHTCMTSHSAGIIPGIKYCWIQAITPITQHIPIECNIVRLRICPSCPCIPIVETPVVKFCGEIILDVTALLELVAAIKIADSPISLAVTTWRLPNNEFAEVSLPDRKQAIQPSQADTNGKAFPTEANWNPMVYTIPVIVNQWPYISLA